MSGPGATAHASSRMQQRGLPPLVLDWLQAYGRELHDHRGATILHFDKRARRRLERAVGREPVRRMKAWLSAYAVVSPDGHVITTGHRFKRIRRDPKGPRSAVVSTVDVEMRYSTALRLSVC